MVGARWAFVLVTAAGCSFTAREQPSDAGPDPDAEVDAPVDAPPDGPERDDDDDDDDDEDKDGDGVEDDDDNCPTVANPGQHDEDDDDKGDACDPCPMLAMASADADDDGDGIGNGCDPRPSQAGDVRVVFDGFGTDLANGTLPAGWTQLGGAAGAWSVTNGALRLDTNDEARFLHYDAGAANATIDLAVEISNPGNIAASVTALADASVGLTSFVGCSLLYNDTPFRRLQSFANDTFTQHESSAASSPAVPSLHRIRARITGTAAACLFQSPPNIQIPLAGGPTPAGGSRVGFRIRGLRVAILYVAIYRSP